MPQACQAPWVQDQAPLQGPREPTRDVGRQGRPSPAQGPRAAAACLGKGQVPAAPSRAGDPCGQHAAREHGQGALSPAAPPALDTAAPELRRWAGSRLAPPVPSRGCCLPVLCPRLHVLPAWDSLLQAAKAAKPTGIWCWNRRGDGNPGLACVVGCACVCPGQGRAQQGAPTKGAWGILNACPTAHPVKRQRNVDHATPLGWSS